jgi:hypothetical protein
MKNIVLNILTLIVFLIACDISITRMMYWYKIKQELTPFKEVNIEKLGHL